MKEVLTWACAFIAAIAVFYVAGGAILLHENRAADAILQSDFNATPMIEPEFSQRQQPPVLNQGNAKLPCAECAEWSGQWINGRFVIKHKGRDVTDEVTGPNIFSKTPPRRGKQ